jgi:Protein of unknown function (DUF664)
MEESIDLTRFIQAVLEASYGWLKRACDGLTDEQLRYQPTATSNSMAWMVWHSSRVKDRVTATIVNEADVWVTAGWAERFGMDPEATGVGDRPEQVAAFQIRRDVLFGYADAAHHITIQRLAQISPAQLGQPVPYVGVDTRPTWHALRGMLGDAYSHTGQISYLRGMITGYGWRAT